jgi:hypothetical protein
MQVWGMETKQDVFWRHHENDNKGELQVRQSRTNKFRRDANHPRDQMHGETANRCCDTGAFNWCQTTLR